MGSALKRTNILSLLQPSPETLKCFDEIILLSQGRVIFAGPAQDAVQWFTSLGYYRPPSIDVADFLLLVASNYDGVEDMLEPSRERFPVLASGLNGNIVPSVQNHHTSSTPFYNSEALAELFKKQSIHSSFHDFSLVRSASYLKDTQQDAQTGSLEREPDIRKTQTRRKRYRNSFLRFVKLNTVRSFTIWRRDKR